jgi:hypothetical protein
MSNFLKLTGRVINTAYIQHVFHDKTLQKYSLYLIPQTNGLFIFGTGSIDTNNEIYATKKDHEDSYKAIDRWIHSIECVSNANKKNKD